MGLTAPWRRWPERSDLIHRRRVSTHLKDFCSFARALLCPARGVHDHNKHIVTSLLPRSFVIQYTASYYVEKQPFVALAGLASRLAGSIVVHHDPSPHLERC